MRSLPKTVATGKSRAPVVNRAALTAALGPLLDLVVDLAIAKIRASGPTSEADPWIPVDEGMSCSRREASDRCRAGRIDGARKLGKRWIARRSAIEAAIERLGVSPPAPAVANDSEAAEPTADDVLAELGLERSPARAGGRR